MRLMLLAAVAASLPFLQPASAGAIKAGAIELSGLWTRATPPNAPTAGGYLTIANTGSEPDRLVSVSSPVAAHGEIHEMKVDDGIMTMRPVDGGIEIPPHETVTLAPGGFHIMFIDLNTRLIEGADVPVTIIFEKAGTVDASLKVGSMGAKGPDEGHAQ